MVWHAETALPKGTDLVVVPGGFSYGDYLRCGAIAARAPVMDAVRDFAVNGGLVLGVCNGFQILCEAGLLPGVLMRNARLKFICQDVHLRVERSDTPFTRGYNAGQVIRVPVAHGEGNYEADEETVEAARRRGAGALSLLLAPTASSTSSNINGAAQSIAGIVNERGNVLGMMPHPENHVEDIMGCTDGRGLFAGLVAHLEKRRDGRSRGVLLARSSRRYRLSPPSTRQDYPKHPITMIVPFAAGGTSDVIARAVAEEMGVVAWTADRDRECRGRRWLDRAGAGGARRSRRLHHCDRQCRHQCGDLHDLSETAVHAGSFVPIAMVAKTFGIVALRKDFPAKTLAGLHRLREEQSRQGQSRTRRHRLVEFPDLQEFCAGCRHRRDAGRLSRRGARADGRDRRPDRRRLRCGCIRCRRRSTTGWSRASSSARQCGLRRLPDLPTSAEAGLPNSRRRAGTACSRQRARRQRSSRS